MGGRLSSFFFGRQDIRALILGLDAAGKTTLLYRMKLGEIVTTIPTIGFNVETVQYKSLTLTAWDVGGRDKMRALMRHYFAGTRVLVYVVDSGDRERLGDARKELHRMKQEDELRDAVLLVLANKQDLEHCLSVQDVSQGLDFPALARHWPAAAIFPVSTLEGEGVAEAWDWVEGRVRATRGETFLLARAGCGALKKAWSVHALLQSTLASARSLLYGKADLQLAGSDLQHTDT